MRVIPVHDDRSSRDPTPASQNDSHKSIPLGTADLSDRGRTGEIRLVNQLSSLAA
jgi:hypothetical protein